MRAEQQRARDSIALIIFDRVCAASWNCETPHARAVRLFFTGGAAAPWHEQQCPAMCRCPLAVLRHGPTPPKAADKP